MAAGLFARPARVFVAIALVCLASVGFAVFTQYQWDMRPCPWCILQRVIAVAVALMALAGAALSVLSRSAVPRGLAAVGVLLLAACGIAAALWQHFVAAASQSCNLTLADKIVNGLGLDEAWPDVFSPQASCADAAVNLLGLPYEVWSLLLFVAVTIATLGTLFSRPRRR